jgi:hypothetical protein
MPEEQRMTYLAGEFDSLAGFATGTASKQMAAHYNKCMKNSGMNLGQFSAHVAAFAQARPDLQGSTCKG